MRTVIRSPAFQRPMRALALVAVLLMASMPSVARWLSPGQGWVELCTMTGLKLVKLDPGAAQEHGGGDCAYCPLLAATVTPGVAPLFAPTAPLHDLAPSPRAPLARLAAPHPCGLGSRGPPLTA